MKNNSLKFSIIDAIDSQVSSLVYIFKEDHELKSEFNYLSEGLFETNQIQNDKAQIIFTKQFNLPFLIYSCPNEFFQEKLLIETLVSFYSSNESASKKGLWIAPQHNKLQERISKEINVIFKTIDS